MTLDEQIKTIAKELSRRQYTYPKLVEAGKMKQEQASYEISAMSFAMQTLTQLRGIIKKGA